MAVEKLFAAQRFGRLITAMVTPFTDKGLWSSDRTRALARHLVDNKTTSIVVCGTTGESPTLDQTERRMIAETVLDEAGDKVCVIAGTGTNDTAETVRLTQDAKDVGVHGLLLVVPSYNKPSQEGLFRHFGDIAEEAPDLPIILYNVPSRTAKSMSPETVWRLAERYPNIVGLKEAEGLTPPDHVDCILWERPQNFTVWSGNDSDTFHFLLHGGYGVVSVASHVVGRKIDEMIQISLNGNIERAESIHNELLPFAQALFPPEPYESSPSAIKYCLNHIGVEVGSLRPPLYEQPEEYKLELRRIMGTLDLDPAWISRKINANSPQ